MEASTLRIAGVDCSLEQRPVRRTATAHGVIVSGGEWVLTCPDGRTFVGTKAAIKRPAGVYLRAGSGPAGEAALTDWLAA